MFWDLLRRVGITRATIARLTGRTRIDKDQIALLKTMRRDNQSSNSPYRATQLWTRFNRQFDDWFYWEGIGEVERQAMNELFSGTFPGNAKLLEYASWLLYQNLRARDKLHLLTSIPATVNHSSGMAFEFEGNWVSFDLLLSLDNLYSISEADSRILTDPVAVVDLGAGWGRLGYVLKRVNPKCAYIICDLPESLLVSSSYLPRIMPHEIFYPYLENRGCKVFTREMLRREGGVRFLGAQDLDRFEDKSIDFFINIASFQEITLAQVDEYFEIIDRKLSGTFYTLQRWGELGRSAQSTPAARDEGLFRSLNDYPFRPAWSNHYIRTVPWSSLYFEAAFSIR
jgi:putative sugar O-methyltransferase